MPGGRLLTYANSFQILAKQQAGLSRENLMARSAQLERRTEKPEGVAAKLHGVFEKHLSKLPPQERKRRWAALEQFVQKHSPRNGTRAKL